MTNTESRLRMGKGCMELVGTAILVCTIQLAGGDPLGALAIGGVLITIVYAGGPISGAHYNPAVSLAVRLRGAMSLDEMSMYWVFQLVGGYLGALVGGIVGGSFGTVAMGAESSTGRAWLAEVVFTFVLCFVVLAVATNSTVANNHYYGAAIGLVVTCGAIAVGPISGGAFNPAVAVGLYVAKASFTNFVYTAGVVVANLVGGTAAAACFYLVAPDQFAGASATAAETANLV